MPNGFAWTRHSHGQRQQGELHSSCWVLRSQQLITADPSEIIHIARFRHSHYGMNQEIGLHLLSSAKSQFLMCSMYGIAGLESDDSPPAQAREFSAQFGRTHPQGTEVVVRWYLDTFDASSHIPGMRLVHDVVRAGMSLACAIEDRFRFGLAVGLPDFFHMQHR